MIQRRLSTQELLLLGEKYFSTALSDLILVNQILAPTYRERHRGDFIRRRLKEFGVRYVSRDLRGNIVARFPKKGSRAILISANLDTIFEETDDVMVQVGEDRLTGNGVANNAGGLAALLALAEMIRKERISFENEVVLLATTGAEREAASSGMRYFLENFDREILFAICLEGMNLGRISHWAFGSTRFALSCHTRGGDSWNDAGNLSAVRPLFEFLSRAHAEELPEQPKTVFNITRIEGGSYFNHIADRCRLEAEILSDDMEVLARLENRFKKIFEELHTSVNASLKYELLGTSKQGGIPNYHYLVESAAELLSELGITSRLAASGGDLAVLLGRGVPAVLLGISVGGINQDRKEYLELEPIKKGLAQILGVIQRAEERALGTLGMA